MSAEKKYKDTPTSRAEISWPTDFIAVRLVPDGVNSNSSSSDGRSTPTDVPISQDLSNLVFGSTATALCMLLFQVGFTNKIAVGLWTPVVVISYLIALAACKAKGGSLTPLLFWNVLLTFSFQLTLTLSLVQCLVLEVTGGRSYTIVALSMLAMLASNCSPRWVVVMTIGHTLSYFVLGFVDALGDCHFSSDSSNFSSLPPIAVVQLFQQILPVFAIVGSGARMYYHQQSYLDQQRVSEDFYVKCLRSALQHDVVGLLAATDEYDQHCPANPPLCDDALHTVIMFLNNIASQPTLVAPITHSPNSFVGDEVKQIVSPPNEHVKSPLHQLKVTQLAAIHNSVDYDSGDNQTETQQPDKISATDAARSRRRASRVGSFHGNLIGLDSQSMVNSATPTRPSSSHGAPVGLAPVKGYLVLFALPKLAAYMMSSNSNPGVAEMFLGEFADVVKECLATWKGKLLITGFNYVIARFSNPSAAVAASVEAQMKMQGHAQHHKDTTLNMLSGHKLLTFTVAGECIYGRPSADSRWAFGFTAVERVFDSALQLFGQREPLPANIIATSLTGETGEFFEFRPSPLHSSVMVVLKAVVIDNGVPKVPAEYLEDIEIEELPDLPILEAAIPKNFRPTQTASDGNRPPLHKTKSLAMRPSSGRAQSANQATKPRKGLPAQVQEVWNTIDTDGNGYLDLSEMETLIKKIGLSMSKSEIRDFFNKIDVDGSGSLTVDEFEDAYYSSTLGGANVISSIRRSAIAMSHSNEREFISLVEKSWRKYDVDGSGKLDEAEVGRILRDLGLNHTPEEVKWMFDRMDRDKSGFVEFDEFMTLFSSDASEFLAVRERIQTVSRVMTKSTATYSTPDQALRDYRVWVLDRVNLFISPFVFLYIWYMFCSTSFYVTLGADIAKVTLLQSLINFALDAVYATWCIAKLVYLPKENRGSVVFKQIWKPHLKTVECWVDLLTIIPADLLFYMIGGDHNGGLIAYYRLNKLLSIYHLDERYKLMTVHFNPAVSRAANALMMFFVFCHILCCVLVGVTRNLGDASTIDLLSVTGILTNEDIRYVVPFYWSILTLSGQLSGASIPVEDTHLFVLQVAVLFGLPLYTVVLGTVGNAATVEDSYTRYLDKVDTLRSFFEYTRLSKEFEDDILDYYKHLYTTTNTLDITENPLDDLPTELSIPLVIAMGSDMLKSVPIFKSASTNLEFVHELTIKLVPRVIEPLAVVMRKGEIGAEMYFITFGNFNIVIDTGKIVFTLNKGNFFGEIALLHSGKRTATIVNSHRFGNVLMLVKDQFQEVARFFPDCLSQVYKAAEDRIQQTKENERKEKEAADKAIKEEKERVAAEAAAALAAENATSQALAPPIVPQSSSTSGADVPPVEKEDPSQPLQSTNSFMKPVSPNIPGPGPDMTAKDARKRIPLTSLGFALGLNTNVYDTLLPAPDTDFDDDTKAIDGQGEKKRRSSGPSYTVGSEGSTTDGGGGIRNDIFDDGDESTTDTSTNRSHSLVINGDDGTGDHPTTITGTAATTLPSAAKPLAKLPDNM